MARISGSTFLSHTNLGFRKSAFPWCFVWRLFLKIDLFAKMLQAFTESFFFQFVLEFYFVLMNKTVHLFIGSSHVSDPNQWFSQIRNKYNNIKDNPIVEFSGNS